MRVLAALLVVLTAAPALAADPSPALKQVIAEASKEGKLDIQWASNLVGGREGLTAMNAGMNAMFGTKIELRFTPGPNLNDIMNTLVVSAQAGRPATTDLAIGSNQHASELWKREVSLKVDWKALLPGRIQDDSIEADGTAIRVFTTLPGGIVYNTQKVPYPPTKLTDFLKPEWKGKVASTPYASGFDLLAASDMWGEEKTLEFARALSSQISGLIRCNELERIASGEFIGYEMDCIGREWLDLKRKGAPIQHVVPEDLPGQRFYYMMVPKNSKAPNAAKLLITFLETPEGQKLIWKYADTDLHTYHDGEMWKEVEAYEKKGIKFKQFTITWFNEHPEALATLRKVVPILTGATK